MPARITKFILGIASLPLCVAASLSFYECLGRIRALSYGQRYFLFGIIAYLVLHVAFFKPQYLYVLGHEFMHVIATWASRGRVTSFEASSAGGKVTTSKSNVFIALAPYFFPFYTILVTIIFFAIPLIFKVTPPYNIFLFLIGLTLAFHIVITLDFLKTKQPDFLHAGRLFSVCLVYLINIMVIAFIFSLLFKNIEFFEFIKSAYFNLKQIYSAAFKQLFL